MTSKMPMPSHAGSFPNFLTWIDPATAEVLELTTILQPPLLSHLLARPEPRCTRKYLSNLIKYVRREKNAHTESHWTVN